LISLYIPSRHVRHNTTWANLLETVFLHFFRGQLVSTNCTLQEWGWVFAPCQTNMAPVAVFSKTSDALLRSWRTEQGTSTRTPSCSSSPRLTYRRQEPISIRT
jgi:hypothetical protein